MHCQEFERHNVVVQNRKLATLQGILYKVCNVNEVNNVVSNGRSKMYKEPDIMFIMNDVNLKRKSL